MKTVFYSFTQEELDELLSSYRFLNRKDNIIVCEAGTAFKINEYYNWKARIMSTAQSQNKQQVLKSDVITSASMASADTQDKDALLRRRIAKFDLDNSTPRLCFNFIKELKNLISEGRL